MPINTALQNLEAIRDKRGYLLPHHGLLALSAPNLLQQYDDLYSSLALTDRYLNRHDHEFVWLGVLMSTQEALGTHHVQRFLDAGGTPDELGSAAAITAIATGSRHHLFIEDHWTPHLPEVSPAQQYLTLFNKMTTDIAAPLAHITACAVHTCVGNWRALDWQIRAAYAAQTEELLLAEALSLAMFPGSIPHYVHAADVWRRIILSEEVVASEPFQQWASLSGQGGFDEASHVKQP
ncbi:hypothetical protein N9C62_02375 [Luminiphilus sp.]|nr:hypothetical protein [Luminiphilus sp.]MDB2643259.1 hypothetical protein [Luminiphilus sp.]MDB4048755.1 hypothetical protein [Luminiphilus sp.]